jgi:hypothetical protein
MIGDFSVCEHSRFFDTFTSMIFRVSKREGGKTDRKLLHHIALRTTAAE